MIRSAATFQNKQLTMSSPPPPNPTKRKLDSNPNASRLNVNTEYSATSNHSRFQKTFFDGGESDSPAKRSKMSSTAKESRVQQRGGGPKGFVTSNYQRSNGAKVLRVANLRQNPRTDSRDYYDRTWEHLEACMTDVFAGRQIRHSLEQLYKGVQDICRQGSGDRLYKNLKDRCKTHLASGVLPTIKVHSRSTNIDILRHVHGCWQEFYNQMVVLEPHISCEC